MIFTSVNWTDRTCKLIILFISCTHVYLVTSNHIWLKFLILFLVYYVIIFPLNLMCRNRIRKKSIIIQNTNIFDRLYSKDIFDSPGNRFRKLSIPPKWLMCPVCIFYILLSYVTWHSMCRCKISFVKFFILYPRYFSFLTVFTYLVSLLCWILIHFCYWVPDMLNFIFYKNWIMKSNIFLSKASFNI